MNHDINITGGADALQINFGGSGFISTGTVYKNDVDTGITYLNGYAGGTINFGGFAISPTDKIKIVLT